MTHRTSRITAKAKTLSPAPYWLAALALAAGLAAVALAPPAHAQTVLPPPMSAPADERQDQIEQLQRQLSAATSDNEKLQHDLNLANREVARLQGLVNELTAANASAVQNAAPPAADAGPARSSSATQAQTGQLGTLPANAAPGSDGYAEARRLLNAGNYAEAETAFAAYLRDNAASQEAPSARYWYAYTLLARNNYADAATSFGDYLRRYPNGTTAPDAQVNLGVALAGLGQNTQACTAFGLVARRYPHAAQAVRDRAAREARALHCAA